MTSFWALLDPLKRGPDEPGKRRPDTLGPIDTLSQGIPCRF